MKPQLYNKTLTGRAKITLLASCIAAVMALSVQTTAVAQSGSVPGSGQGLAELASDAAVGEVSLVLGRAWLESGSQGRALIVPGTVVRATDRILTESNGHVHIRFVDQALVSVRPDSRLEIVQYDYSADQPQRSAIKLNLQEGITRSISGHGATSARERFRLNTPIAAIGVRGTDFVVSATSSSVRALVNEGAIVLAPYSNECTAAAFGPCMTNAVELTDNTLQMIEMDGSNTAPRLLPAAIERESGMQEEIRTAVNETEAGTEDKTVGTRDYLENVTSQRVKDDLLAVSRPPRPPAPATDFTPPESLSTASLIGNNMVWGRWGDGQSGQERITTPAPALVASGLTAMIGTNGYTLFQNGRGRTLVQPGLGTVSLQLDSAQAFYHSASGVVAMAVSGGKLDINFDTSQFSTQLNLSHALTGKVNFAASGVVNSEGIFYADLPVGAFSGAVSFDGREAGYFFEQQLQNGGIKGLTLWDRP